MKINHWIENEQWRDEEDCPAWNIAVKVE